MKEINKMELKFKAISENESFARASVAGFCLGLNPTMNELTDIKTAVSEAVTNSIVHAYPTDKKGDVTLTVTIYEGNLLKIEIRDYGVGIKDVDKAKQPFFTTKPNEERSGMGFTVMESFMDTLSVKNKNSGGVLVELTKKIESESEKMKKLG